MKAVRLQGYGDVDQFRLEDVPTPVPGEGEVLIDVAASGLNPVDLYYRQGFMAQYVPLELPAVLGNDAAGIIAAVGPGANGFVVGDRVVAKLPAGKGGHAERAVASIGAIAKLPANVDFVAGATLPLVGLTGRQAVDALGVKPGDRVLVSGALGAVGRVAVQYLKELGAQPVAGVRAERLGEGRALAGEAIDIDAAPAAPEFDFAISTAAPVATNALKHVRPGGTLASVVGPVEGASTDHIKFVGVMGHPDPKTLQGVADAVGRGDLALPIAARFPLGELAAAHGALAGSPRGKIVLVN